MDFEVCSTLSVLCRRRVEDCDWDVLENCYAELHLQLRSHMAQAAVIVDRCCTECGWPVSAHGVDVPNLARLKNLIWYYGTTKHLTEQAATLEYRRVLRWAYRKSQEVENELGNELHSVEATVAQEEKSVVVTCTDVPVRAE